MEVDNASLEKVNLWNTPHVRARCTIFYSKISEYFDTEKYIDVNITCQDRVFKCHRLVLAAASEYFNAMFGGNFQESCTQNITLQDIDSASFELALHYMYRGSVPAIGDDDVFNLLRTASILNLDYVEERCIHYLTERNVPTEDALEIFLYACVTQNKTLISCASQCILQLLGYFSTKSSFLGMSLEELSTLLEFVPLSPNSREKEYILLNAIRQWVSNLACLQEEKNSYFLKLTQNISFQHIPVVFSDGCNHTELYLNMDTDSKINKFDSTLHVYLNLKYSNPNIPGGSQTSVFTLKEDNHEECWNQYFDIDLAIEYMRTITLNNQLYCLQSKFQSQQLSFIKTSSLDLTTDIQSLSVPTLTYSPYPGICNFSMCRAKNGIYVCSPYGSENLLHYNCELDKWFPVSLISKEEFSPHLITLCNNQLYIVGREPKSAISEKVRAYDDRTGKLEVLPDCLMSHNNYDEMCCHKEKIYVSKANWNFGVEVYNPVTSKWDIILEDLWSESDCGLSDHRLVSFKNKLWKFTVVQTSLTFSSLQRNIVECYDSFTEKWDECSFMLNSAVETKKYYNRSYALQRGITDVIIY